MQRFIGGDKEKSKRKGREWLKDGLVAANVDDDQQHVMVDEHAYSQPMMEERRGRCSQILNASRVIGDAASKPNKQRGVARWGYMRNFPCPRR